MKKIVLMFIATLSLEQIVYAAAAKPTQPKPSLALPELVSHDKSITDLMQQIFIDKHINNQTFSNQELNQALQALNTEQANTLYLIFKVLLDTIHKMSVPTMNPIPPLKNLRKDQAIELIITLIHQFIEIKKINQKKPTHNQFVDLGIKSLSNIQKEKLLSLLNLIIKQIPQEIALTQKASTQTAAAPTIHPTGRATPSKLTPLSYAPQPPKSLGVLQPRSHQPLPTKTQASETVSAGTPVTATHKHSTLPTKHPLTKQKEELRKEEAQKIKNAKITDEEIQKILKPSDPRFKEIYDIIEKNDVPAAQKVEFPMEQDPNGYSPLLHAVYKNRIRIMQLLLSRINKLIYGETDPAKLKKYNLMLYATIKGLNAYEFASFLAQRNDKLLDIKTMLRSIFSAELPAKRIVVPADIVVKNTDELLAWVDSRSPSNTIFIVDPAVVGDLYATNLIFVSLLDLQKRNPSNENLILFSELMKRNINVRYELAQMLRKILMGFGLRFNRVFEHLVHKAIEQGEPIENILEIYYSIKQNYHKTEAEKKQLKFFREIIRNHKVARGVQEELIAHTNKSLPLVLFTPSNPELVKLKNAIQDFYKNVIKDSSASVEQPTPDNQSDSEESDDSTYGEYNSRVRTEDRHKLQKALGHNNKNLSLQDGLGYTPLLYAVYLNKLEAVRFLVEEIIALQGQIIKLSKAIENDNKQLKETVEQISKLSQNNEALQNNKAAIKKLEDQEKNIRKKTAESRTLLAHTPTPGAIFAMTTTGGMNAFCLAKFFGYKEIMKLLKPYFKDECPQ
jgi:ankyrin repeat protein